MGPELPVDPPHDYYDAPGDEERQEQRETDGDWDFHHQENE